MAAGEVVVDAADDLITVIAPDRRGLFSRVAGVLALHGLDVVAADAAAEGDMAIEAFRVTSRFGSMVPWDRVVANVHAALTDRLAIEARLADRIRTYQSRSTAHRLPPPVGALRRRRAGRRHGGGGARPGPGGPAVPGEPGVRRAGHRRAGGQGADPRRPRGRLVLRDHRRTARWCPTPWCAPRSSGRCSTPSPDGGVGRVGGWRDRPSPRPTSCGGPRPCRASPAPGWASPRASTSGSASRRCWPWRPTSATPSTPTSTASC